MSSRREEERNEKIIRGLMKLPPNRRCINCDSLAPQYVCTNFWTFVCITCSGIHREFTHRVKSVSMAKFTTQEVEALQKGGNQRARETYLKNWDLQRQRLPSNSNAEKIREFIKTVYVDKRYAGGQGQTMDRPPRDTQNLRGQDETRRASSYHSYSQSPPYDFQYEERIYGKHGPSLTRKPGSDRGLYDGKVSSFSSPSHLSDHMNEDRFANEGSNPRASDFSVSSSGDPVRFGCLDNSQSFNSVGSFDSIEAGSELENPVKIHPNKSSATQCDDNTWKNEGWATFDTPLFTAGPDGSDQVTPVSMNDGWTAFDMPHHMEPIVTDTSLEKYSSSLSLLHFPSIQSSTQNGPSSFPYSEARGGYPSMAEKPWKAFENNSSDFLPLQSAQRSNHQGGLQEPSRSKSTNPFDVPYEPTVQTNNIPDFWDMTSIQAALPNGEMPIPFAGDFREPWFAPNTVASYISATGEGTLGFISAQPTGNQISNLATQGPIAGKNPFA